MCTTIKTTGHILLYIDKMIRLFHIRWGFNTVEMEQVQHPADSYRSDILYYIKKALSFSLFTTHRLSFVPPFSVLALEGGERERKGDRNRWGGCNSKMVTWDPPLSAHHQCIHNRLEQQTPSHTYIRVHFAITQRNGRQRRILLLALFSPLLCIMYFWWGFQARYRVCPLLFVFA